MLKAFLEASISGGATKTYIDDVFSAYTYTGNGATQAITNGVGLASKGGMVWTKCRNNAYGAEIADTVRGVTKYLQPSTTTAQFTDATTVTAFNSDGYTVNTDAFLNQASQSYISWAFRKAPKFFDIVTWVGDGTANRVISHSLGITPGFIITKDLTNATDWPCSHRSLSATGKFINLNQTGAESGVTTAFGTHTATTFQLGSNVAYANGIGSNYVAYLFAHDPSADGVIQCGSFENSSTISVNLGWEPQYLLIKKTTGNGNWDIFDTSRGIPNSTGSVYPSGLQANLTSSESDVGVNIQLTPTGFTVSGYGANTFVYMAIRRSNKPPTNGTQVYKAIARTGTGASVIVTGVGFAPDLFQSILRSGSFSWGQFDRLRGDGPLASNSAGGESGPSFSGIFNTTMDGVKINSSNISYNAASNNYINHFFKRATGFMDVVCYTGTQISKTEQHSLGTVPELIITKARSSTSSWAVYDVFSGPTKFTLLNSTQASGVAPLWNNTLPTSSVFSLGADGTVNASSITYVAYLFASLPGISKVFSYTGNGSSQTINCGFSNGARFVLIKRTDNTGDWFVWDTARGITAGNDPHLSLNTTVAEVTTDDSIDPDPSGFIVNQLGATNINVNAATYIGLAIA